MGRTMDKPGLGLDPDQWEQALEALASEMPSRAAWHAELWAK